MPMPQPSIQEIVMKAKVYLPTLNEGRISRAFDFAEKAHNGQKRFSGEPYIIHPLNVTSLLLEFHPDEEAIIAALLHDVVEDTPHTLDEIEMLFGKEVRNLCWGMEKLSKVRSKLDDPHVGNLRKLFLAMAKDYRVVLLKLCDRLHNMKTLQFVRPDKQRRIAQETINIYAPIAARLGIYRLKSELEDLCFYYLESSEYKNIQDQLVKTEKWRAEYIESAQKNLATILAGEGMTVQIDGRVKSIYSIHRKLRKKNKNFVQDIFDVFAMRLVLPDIYKYGKEYTGHLYTALGIIHNHFTPLANRFKDYVAVPKVNGYRSLHTTVMGLGAKLYTQPAEIQIKTESMHHAAEFGIAAHWMYEGITDFSLPIDSEEAIAESSSPFLKQHQEWISDLHQVERKMRNNQEFLEHLKIDMFQDRIFVLTPRGEVKDLPASATPIDFAYTVHTEIGNHCVGAKVNGNIVPLDYELKNGEVVEIITRKNARPSQQWLSFAKTSHARDRIRAWFRSLDSEKHLREGKLLLNAKLQQLGKALLDDRLSLLRNYGGENLSMQEREDLLIEIGKGGIFPSAVVKNLFTLQELLMEREGAGIGRPTRKVEQQEQKVFSEPLLSIGNQENVPYQFVKCCHPDFIDALVGYVTRGRGVSVHKEHCSVVRNMEKTRLIPVRVLGRTGKTEVAAYSVLVRVEAFDRVGLIRDISNAIAKNIINILKIDQETPEQGIVTVYFLLEIATIDQLERVLSDLEKVASVRRAVKVSSGSSASSV